MPKAKSDPLQDDKVKEAVECLADAQDGWRDIYDAAEDDLAFYLPENQWSASDRKARGNKPSLVVNRLPAFVHQVVNDIRQNTPTVKFLPVDSQADPETAELIQDLFRNTEQISQADVAYQTAMEFAIKCSIGFVQVDHDYTAPDTFEQHILIRRITNPLAVMIDPASMKADGSDATYGFKLDKMSKDKFEREYPDASPTNFDFKYMAKNAASFRSSDGFVTIAEFFQQQPEERTILLLDNGLIIDSEELADLDGQFTVKQQRTIIRNKVMRYKLTGAEILAETEFPSSYIPLVPFYGEEHWADGKRHLISLIRNAKDPQKLHNFWASTEADLLIKQPKAPWLVAAGAIERFAAEWGDPDLAEALRYDAFDPTTGAANPMPQRQPPVQIPTGIVNARASTVDDIKASMGMFDASLGQRSNENSGRAIIARQKEGDTATYHFSDNGSRSIEHIGRIFSDMAPRVYDTPRIMRALSLDGTAKLVPINGATMSGAPPGPEDRIHDIRVGKYDVAVSTGPSYATKRQQSADMMMQLVQSYPPLAQIAGDLIIKSMDGPGMEALAERVAKTIPANLKEGEDGDSEVPDLRPQMQQAQQFIQQLQTALQSTMQQNQQLQQKAGDTSGNIAVKMRELDIKEQELKLKALQFQTLHAKAAADIASKHNAQKIAAMKADADIEFREKELALEAMQTEASILSDHLSFQSELAGTVLETESDKAIAHMNNLAELLKTPDLSSTSSGNAPDAP